MKIPGCQLWHFFLVTSPIQEPTQRPFFRIKDAPYQEIPRDLGAWCQMLQTPQKL